jgi:hypothetical protein
MVVFLFLPAEISIASPVDRLISLATFGSTRPILLPTSRELASATFKVLVIALSLLSRRLEDIMALEERITLKISKRYTICLLVWNNAGTPLLDYAFSKLRLLV